MNQINQINKNQAYYFYYLKIHTSSMTQHPNHFSNSLRLMGQFELHLQHRQVSAELSYDKARLLLAMLVMAKDHKLDRNTLSNTIWEEVPNGVRRARLRHALHIVKQTLNCGTEIITTHKDAIQLNLQRFFVDALIILDSDKHASTSTSDTLYLYEGSFLNGFKFPLNSKLDLWHKHQQASIEQALQRLRKRLCQQELHVLETDAALNVLQHCRKHWPNDHTTSHAWQTLQEKKQMNLPVTAWPVPDFLHTALKGPDLLPAHRQQLAVMAITLHSTATSPNAIDAAQWRTIKKQIEQVLAPSAMLVHHASEAYILAYYEHPECAKQLAHSLYVLTQRLLTLPIKSVALSIGLHALPRHSLHTSATPYRSLLESALMLSWQACPGQVLLSLELAICLPDHTYQSHHIKQSPHYQLKPLLS